MRWTAEKDAEFRALAPTGIGLSGIAARLGCSYHAARCHGIQGKIEVLRPSPAVVAANARWAILIGPMKERLRADVQAIMASR